VMRAMRRRACVCRLLGRNNLDEPHRLTRAPHRRNIFMAIANAVAIVVGRL
jgi:hypothetical protein